MSDTQEPTPESTSIDSGAETATAVSDASEAAPEVLAYKFEGLSKDDSDLLNGIANSINFREQLASPDSGKLNEIRAEIAGLPDQGDETNKATEVLKSLEILQEVSTEMRNGFGWRERLIVNSDRFTGTIQNAARTTRTGGLNYIARRFDGWKGIAAGFVTSLVTGGIATQIARTNPYVRGGLSLLSGITGGAAVQRWILRSNLESELQNKGLNKQDRRDRYTEIHDQRRGLNKINPLAWLADKEQATLKCRYQPADLLDTEITKADEVERVVAVLQYRQDQLLNHQKSEESQLSEADQELLLAGLYRLSEERASDITTAKEMAETGETRLGKLDEELVDESNNAIANTAIANIAATKQQGKIRDSYIESREKTKTALLKSVMGGLAAFAVMGVGTFLLGTARANKLEMADLESGVGAGDADTTPTTSTPPAEQSPTMLAPRGEGVAPRASEGTTADGQSVFSRFRDSVQEKMKELNADQAAAKTDEPEILIGEIGQTTGGEAATRGAVVGGAATTAGGAAEALPTVETVDMSDRVNGIQHELFGSDLEGHEKTIASHLARRELGERLGVIEVGSDGHVTITNRSLMEEIGIEVKGDQLSFANIMPEKVEVLTNHLDSLQADISPVVEAGGIPPISDAVANLRGEFLQNSCLTDLRFNGIDPTDIRLGNTAEARAFYQELQKVTAALARGENPGIIPFKAKDLTPNEARQVLREWLKRRLTEAVKVNEMGEKDPYSALRQQLGLVKLDEVAAAPTVSATPSVTATSPATVAAAPVSAPSPAPAVVPTVERPPLAVEAPVTAAAPTAPAETIQPTNVAVSHGHDAVLMEARERIALTPDQPDAIAPDGVDHGATVTPQMIKGEPQLSIDETPVEVAARTVGPAPVEADSGTYDRVLDTSQINRPVAEPHNPDVPLGSHEVELDDQSVTRSATPSTGSELQAQVGTPASVYADGEWLRTQTPVKVK